MSDTSAYGAFRHRMDAVLNGYMTTGLWSDSCNGTAVHDDCRGEDCDVSLSHDLNFGTEHITASAAEAMEADVEGFIKSCLQERPDCFDRMADEDIGYDFYLTRNGAGAGFWDRGLGELGDFLTAIAKPFGDCRMYVISDGEVGYQS